jgi:hypothetical protein
LLLFCCCLKIERKNYIQKQTISKTHDEFFLGGRTLYKKRERERNKRGDDSCHFTSLSRAKKKIRALRMKRKHNKQTSEKEKKTTKQTDDFFFFVRRKHFTPILEDSFIRKKKSVLLLSSSSFEKRSGVFSRRRF